MRLRSIARNIVVAGIAATLAACQGDVPSAPIAITAPASAARGGTDYAAIVAAVRRQAAERGIVALPPRLKIRHELVELGQALAFDPILSGNRNTACMTCHLPAFATGDARSLSIGEGGVGFGPARTHPTGALIPRNAPPAFNMAAMRHLFWDGRVATGAHGEVLTPAGAQVTPAMQRAFEFGPISAIGMFPVTSRAEMRGASGNELAAIDDADNPAIWAGLMNRLGEIPEYRKLFAKAYPGTKFSDLTFAHASNAIGAFLVDGLTFDDTPWDRFLAGNDHALTRDQLDGAQTFMALKCSVCHTGATFSDEQFHNVAVPQIGPGAGDGIDGHDDFGRMRVTGLQADKYRFRTTPLRNVELTAPYGHDGSIGNLRDFIEHYSDSDVKLMAFDGSGLDAILRGTVQPNQADILATRDDLLAGVVLTPDLIDRLMSYMSALTDERARHLSHIVPTHVPSGLPVVPRRP
jgi:cytochrome c peroxidase